MLLKTLISVLNFLIDSISNSPIARQMNLDFRLIVLLKLSSTPFLDVGGVNNCWTYLDVAGKEDLHSVRELEGRHVGVRYEGCPRIEGVVCPCPKVHQLHSPENAIKISAVSSSSRVVILLNLLSLLCIWEFAFLCLHVLKSEVEMSPGLWK